MEAKSPACKAGKLLPKFILTIFGIIVTTCCLAQLPKLDSAKHTQVNEPIVSLGLGAGLNNYCGIVGAGVVVKVAKPLYVRMGIGVGSWGSKISGSLAFKTKQASGWMVNVGYSYCSGLNNFSPSLQTIDPATGNTVTKNVNMNLSPMSTINLTLAYDWVFHKKNFFFLEFGYALPIQSGAMYTITDGSVLTSTSQEAVKIDSPGGLSLGIGVMWGIE